MLTLTIIKGEREWLVRHSDPEVKRLFGTDTLPTPFLLSMPLAQVQVRITQLNPDCYVGTQEHN